MPSPIAHLAAGYALSLVGRKNIETSEVSWSKRPMNGRFVDSILLITGVGSLLPDFDSAVGLLLGDFGRYHNNLTHSFAAGLVGAGVLALLSRWLFKWPLRPVFGLLFASYAIHILMDAASHGRGVMLFWPLTDQRYGTPIPLFYGLRWSQGWLSLNHIVTLITELIFGGFVIRLARYWVNKR